MIKLQLTVHTPVPGPRQMWNETTKVSDIVTPPQYLPSPTSNGTTSEPTTSPPAAGATDSTEPSAPGRPWHASLLSLPSTEILCVSQFTLYAHTAKGAKPDFHRSMKGPDAKKIYDALLVRIGELLGSADRVKDGVFGAMMDVSLTNDGPVTLIVDTADSRKSSKK